MVVEVRYTPDFEKQLKRLANKYPSINKDLAALIDDLESTPTIGEPLGKNLFKVRLAISARAKEKAAAQE